MAAALSQTSETSSVKTATHPPNSRSNGNSAPLPKYYQLRETLREQIEVLQAGQPIPSENELCLAHDVSRITVRKALNDLIHQGLLYTVQGKGTFVSPHKFRVQWAPGDSGLSRRHGAARLECQSPRAGTDAGPGR